MESFREYLAKIGIDVPMEGSSDPKALFISMTGEQLQELLSHLGVKPESSIEAIPQEFSNRYGDGFGVKYELPEGQAIRFNADSVQPESIGSVNLWKDSTQSKPDSQVGFDGVPIDEIITELAALIKAPEVNNIEKEVELPNENRKKKIPVEIIDSLNEEGVMIRQSQKAFQVLEEGKYRIGDEILPSATDVVKSLWGRGYDRTGICEVSNLPSAQVSAVLKDIGVLKVIDVRPGLKEKLKK